MLKTNDTEKKATDSLLLIFLTATGSTSAEKQPT